MFFETASLKNSDISKKSIGDWDLQVFRKALLLEVYNKFMFLINTTEYDNMLMFTQTDWLIFNIFILPE